MLLGLADVTPNLSMPIVGADLTVGDTASSMHVDPISGVPYDVEQAQALAAQQAAQQAALNPPFNPLPLIAVVGVVGWILWRKHGSEWKKKVEGTLEGIF